MSLRDPWGRLSNPVHRRSLATAAAVAAIGLSLALLHIANHPALSPLDEATHFDSVVQESGGHLVARGDDMGEAALHGIACRGIDSPGYVPPPCVPEGVPVDFHESRFNTSYMHPPVYYVATGLGARALHAIGPSLLVASRIVNGVWFALGLVLMYVLMGEVGLAGVVRACAALLPALVPFVVFQSATVTNDVTAIPTAAFVLLAGLRYERRAWPAWPVAVLSALAVSLRVTNFFGLGIAVGYLAVRGVTASDHADRRRLWRTAAAAAGACAVAGIAWIVVVAARAHVAASALPLANLIPKKFTVRQMFESVAPMVPPTQSLPDVGFWTSHSYTTLLAASVGWLVVAGPFIACMRGSRDRLGVALGASAGLVLLLVGPALAIINAISDDSFLGFPFPARMGFSVLPACLAAAATGIRGRWPARLLTIYVAVGLLGVLAIVGG